MRGLRLNLLINHLRVSLIIPLHLPIPGGIQLAHVEVCGRTDPLSHSRPFQFRLHDLNGGSGVK